MKASRVASSFGEEMDPWSPTVSTGKGRQAEAEGRAGAAAGPEGSVASPFSLPLYHLFIFDEAGRAESEEPISSRSVCVCLHPKMSNHRLPLDSWQQRGNKTAAAFIAEKHKTDSFS